MGTMVRMYKVMFHVKHRVLKFYSVGWAFIAIPDVSAVVLLVSGFEADAFSGSFLDWQSFCEQELQPRFVVKHWSPGIKPIMAVTDFLGNNKKFSVTCRPICSVLMILPSCG